jgi:hypothetical protein
MVGIALRSRPESPETLCWIFLKEFPKENYDRLWDIVESFKW